MRIPGVLAASLLVALVALPSGGPGQRAIQDGARPQAFESAAVALDSRDTPENGASRQTIPQTLRYQYSEDAGRDNDVFHFRQSEAGFEAQSGSLTLAVDGHSANLTFESSTFGVTPVGVGREIVDAVTAPASPRVTANRLEWDRGPVTEWFVNGPLGIQQAWTVHSRPAGSGPLVLDLAVVGGGAQVTSDRDTVLVAPSGTTVPYSGLFAFDAKGTELPARFASTSGGLAIAVEDASAVYPIVIDPMAVVLQLSAGDYTEDNMLFGASVAVSGDGSVIAIGAAGGGALYSPAIYVYTRSPQGWNASPRLPARLVGMPFGVSASTVAISADGKSIVGAGPLGAQTVLLFERPGATWTGVINQKAKLSTPDASLAAPWDVAYGASIALSDAGEVVVVGDPSANGPSPLAGAAFVFQKPLLGWTDTLTHSARLSASAADPFARLGRSVAVNGDGSMAVVGAPDQTCLNFCGAMYTFYRPGGAWAGYLEPTSFHQSDPISRIPRLGSSVAVSTDGKTMAAGGCLAPASSCDAIAVFTTTTTFISSTQAALLKFSAPPQNFGGSIAMTGDGRQIAAIGRSPREAYLFTRPQGGWAGSVLDLEPLATSFPPNPLISPIVPLAFARDGSTMVIGNVFGGVFASGAASVLVQPTFADFSPKSGKPGDVISITGSSLYAVTGVTFGGTAAFARGTVSPAVMTATVGTGASGSVSLAVGNGSISLPGFTFVKGPTSIALGTQRPASSVPNEPVVFKYALNTALPNPAGTVTITASTGERCVTSAASGECAITFFTVGERAVAAEYGGSAGYLPSASAPITHGVLLPTLTLINKVSSTNPDSLTPVTVEFSVSGIGIFIPPAGVVTVSATTGESCSATVAEGKCVLTFANGGPRIITAYYGGSANLSPSTSNSVALGVVLKHYLYMLVSK